MSSTVALLKLNNGKTIHSLGFGTWKAEKGLVGKAVIEAIKQGFRHIDCAEGYANEAEIGEALQEAFKSGIVKREDLFITSKVWGSNFDIIEKRLRNTLKQLQIESFDLYLLHCPTSLERSPEGRYEPIYRLNTPRDAKSDKSSLAEQKT